MMSQWQKFLDSLATRGAAILVLLVMVGATDGAAFVLYLKHDLDVRGLTYIVTSGGLISTLMLALKSSSEPPGPPSPPNPPPITQNPMAGPNVK